MLPGGLTLLLIDLMPFESLSRLVDFIDQFLQLLAEKEACVTMLEIPWSQSYFINHFFYHYNLHNKSTRISISSIITSQQHNITTAQHYNSTTLQQHNSITVQQHESTTISGASKLPQLKPLKQYRWTQNEVELKSSEALIALYSSSFL